MFDTVWKKKRGKRGSEPFITAEGKAKVLSFAPQKVSLRLFCRAPEASPGDLSISSIAAMLTDTRSSGEHSSLKKHLSVSCFLIVSPERQCEFFLVFFKHKTNVYTKKFRAGIVG